MKMGEGPLPRKSLVFGRITVNGTILRSFAVAELLSTVYQLSGVRSSHHCAQGLSSLFLPSAQGNDLSSSTPITLSMTTWDKWQIPSLPETSLVAQMVKRLSTMLEPWVWSLDREVPWRRKRQPTPVPLPRKSHGWRSLVSMGSQRVRHDWATSLNLLPDPRSVCVCVCVRVCVCACVCVCVCVLEHHNQLRQFGDNI